VTESAFTRTRNVSKCPGKRYRVVFRNLLSHSPVLRDLIKSDVTQDVLQLPDRHLNRSPVVNSALHFICRVAATAAPDPEAIVLTALFLDHYQCDPELFCNDFESYWIPFIEAGPPVLRGSSLQLNVFTAGAILGHVELCVAVIAVGGTSKWPHSQYNKCRRNVHEHCPSSSVFDLSAASLAMLSRIPTEFSLALIRAQRNYDLKKDLTKEDWSCIARDFEEILSYGELSQLVVILTNRARTWPYRER
jgi:hypothetical protein